MRKILFISLLLFVITSCHKASLFNNKALYGTEWATSNSKEGLRFYNDDTVTYFASGYSVATTGTFKYSPALSTIDFSHLIIEYPSFTAEITYADVDNDEKMTVYWHNLGDQNNNYMVLYKVR